MRFYSRACRLQLLLGQLLILIILVPELMVVAQDEVPINFGDWGEMCTDERPRAGRLVEFGPCDQDCDCEMQPWICDLETGVRSAECTVRKIRTGAGKACPERKISKCDVNCREDVFFGEWSKCPEGGGERIQTRGIRRFARNNGRQCVVENRQTCTDCRVSYGNWSACDTSQPGLPKMSRKVTIEELPTNGGHECPFEGVVGSFVNEEAPCDSDCKCSMQSAVCDRETGVQTQECIVEMERSGSGKECSFDNPGDDVKDYEKIENYGLFSNGTLKIFTGEVITIPTTKRIITLVGKCEQEKRCSL